MSIFENKWIQAMLLPTVPFLWSTANTPYHAHELDTMRIKHHPELRIQQANTANIISNLVSDEYVEEPDQGLPHTEFLPHAIYDMQRRDFPGFTDPELADLLDDPDYPVIRKGDKELREMEYTVIARKFGKVGCQIKKLKDCDAPRMVMHLSYKKPDGEEVYIGSERVAPGQPNFTGLPHFRNPDSSRSYESALALMLDNHETRYGRQKL